MKIVSILMVIIIIVSGKDVVYANQGTETSNFNDYVELITEKYENQNIEELDNEINKLNEKYESVKKQNFSNNPQDYYSDFDLATLEALNNLRAEVIKSGGVALGAKEEGEDISSQPINENSKNSNWSYYGWGGEGDIFIQTYTTLGAGIGDYGHAALGGKQISTTIEAPGPGYKVQWRTDHWFEKLGGDQIRAKNANGAWAWYRVRNASLSQYTAAVNYADTRIKGAPYPEPIAWKFYNPNMSAWEYHCGEVVHFAWLSGAGIRVSNSLDNKAIGPYGMGPQHKYGQTYRYRGDLSSKGSNN
ncbi:MAG: hypothetical protein ACRC5Q_02825 [Culicoidibacterales bacterium]